MRRWMIGLAVLVIPALGLFGCMSVVLPAVPAEVERPAARPPVLAALGDDPAVENLDDWTNRRAPLLRTLFQETVYGVPPESAEARIADTRLVEADAYGGLARLEELTVDVEVGGESARFLMMLATPNNAPGPSPIILIQTFCGNRAAFGGREDVSAPLGPYPGVCDNGFAEPVVELVFGRAISEPPVQRILARGYAVAIFYAGDVVPDETEAGTQALARLAGGQPRWGAIAAWGWLYSRAIDALSDNARIDLDQVAVWGHSRNGKSALFAAALDPRIGLVIAHQSGTGGATLSRNAEGESIEEITSTYPHWFAETFASYAGREDELPVDQHMLLALIAPRPVLLGNARRDAWSDPHGAFRAAQGADAVYELFGVEGFEQSDMRETNFDAELAYYFRNGRHGVTTSDWDVFLHFLDAHFTRAER